MSRPTSNLLPRTWSMWKVLKRKMSQGCLGEGSEVWQLPNVIQLGELWSIHTKIPLWKRASLQTPRRKIGWMEIAPRMARGFSIPCASPMALKVGTNGQPDGGSWWCCDDGSWFTRTSLQLWTSMQVCLQRTSLFFWCQELAGGGGAFGGVTTYIRPSVFFWGGSKKRVTPRCPSATWLIWIWLN